MRHNSQCPHCRYYAATFFAKTEDGMALMKCNNIQMRQACGRFFRAPHPVPMRRVELREAA